MKTTIDKVLAGKGGEIWSLGPDATVYDALAMMADKEIGALLVREGERPVGIFSERDYARKVVLQGRSSQDTPLRDIMTTQLVCVKPDQTVEECMALMTDKRIRHLPVMKDDQLVGVISIGDLVKAMIAEQQFLIEQLEHYIVG